MYINKTNKSKIHKLGKFRSKRIIRHEIFSHSSIRILDRNSSTLIGSLARIHLIKTANKGTIMEEKSLDGEREHSVHPGNNAIPLANNGHVHFHAEYINY